MTKPESTTYFIPSIVIEASATLVLIITFLVRGGGGSKTSICCSVDNPECSAKGSKVCAPSGNLDKTGSLSDSLNFRV